MIINAETLSNVFYCYRYITCLYCGIFGLSYLSAFAAMHCFVSYIEQWVASIDELWSFWQPTIVHTVIV